MAGRVEEGTRWQHYKGTVYVVIGLAVHSENLDDLVLYRGADDSGPTWARPLSMWHEEVEVDGEWVRRFTLLTARPAGGEGEGT